MTRSGLRVLVVDDSELIRTRLLDMLSDIEGVDSESAAGVTEAARAIRVHAPHVVVLDIQMPDGSGLDLLPTILAAEHPVTVIVLTAHASPHLREKSLSAGADFFFDKGLEFQRVAEVVGQLLTGCPDGTPGGQARV